MRVSCGFALAVLLGLSGCVGLQKYADDVQTAENKGYIQGFSDCWDRYVLRKEVKPEVKPK